MAELEKSGISDEDAQRLRDFVVAFAAELGLAHHWVKILDTVPDEDDAIAQVDHNQQRYLVSIRVCKDWSEYSEFERFHTAVHETVHMTHRRVETVVRRAENLMHDYEYADFINDFGLEIELMVDQMALAWCQVPKIRQLWYGDNEPDIDTEAGVVAGVGT